MLQPPDWPQCGHGANLTTGAGGCHGIQVPSHTACLAHLNETDRAGYLAGLAPGTDIDHRGTPFTEDLLSELLTALREPATGTPHFGRARFERAVFEGTGGFDGADFSGSAWFDQANFSGDAQFRKAKFGEDARFADATISGRAWFTRSEIRGEAWFHRAKFGGDADFYMAKIERLARFAEAHFSRESRFVGVTFSGGAWFPGVQFDGGAEFAGAVFSGSARFIRVQFTGDAVFAMAEFERNAKMGPIACTGTLNLSEAAFRSAVTIEAAAATVLCRRTQWDSTAALRLRYASVDLTDAVWEYPVSVAARSRPFLWGAEEVAEPGLTDPHVRIMSLRGVDAAHLVLTGVDLSDCRFAGTLRLDQLRLEGRYTFTFPPSGLRWHGMRPVRWTQRRALAEEHHWRSTRFVDAGGWRPAPAGEDALEPAELAPVYRQLRKSFEDSKHEPGAADFYYGEMEMRRHADDIPWVERALLTIYWALSGYGLRASRAMGWLLASMFATVLMMMLWGLPQDDPRSIGIGVITDRSITMTMDTPDPVNPTEPWHERLSTDRFEGSLRVVINSVIFRASGQNLTTAGTYIEMASRITEPVLLGLAILAIRGRVKR
ncbi:pentapeptide repeat-containing protein [Streptomyces sp. PSKA54]|uniref:Pentapeptide repeat-containing protein n=2 Tax=Streptomyces TaxID=1883 RepID=A0A7W2HHE6_9ACTN|nr:pentapeptide repeat-containing protein [Streptomyces himalayensis subsp. aureolus]